MNNSNLGLENIGNLSELLGNAEVSSGTPLRLPLLQSKKTPINQEKNLTKEKFRN